MQQSTNPPNNPCIAILMCTYNGETYLADQLDSIAAQTNQHWKLYVSDDRSTDNTLAILAQYQQHWGVGKIEILCGPSKGSSTNFLSLACKSGIEADFFAFCDQDDVWLPNKLDVALYYLLSQDQTKPQLYGGRTTNVDESLNIMGASPLFVFPCGFRNALVQSFAGGNTMVFNRVARQLLCTANITEVPIHDWWTYLLISGAGGNVFLDPNSYILYRQHSQALIGANTSTTARLKRIFSVWRGELQTWTNQHVIALKQCYSMLDTQSKKTLDAFVRLRGGSLHQRLQMLNTCGLYRQTWRGTFMLYFAILMNKL